MSEQAYIQMRRSALAAVRQGERFEAVAARYNYTVSTIQRWAKAARVYRGIISESLIVQASVFIIRLGGSAYSSRVGSGS